MCKKKNYEIDLVIRCSRACALFYDKLRRNCEHMYPIEQAQTVEALSLSLRLVCVCERRI